MTNKTEAIVARLDDLTRAMRALRQEAGHTGMGDTLIVLPSYVYKVVKAHATLQARREGNFFVVPEYQARDRFEHNGVAIVSGSDF